MIENLAIENLVLVERANISFGPSLNIITGETGAGKSAILSAIRLILGDRADPQLIRKGAERAVVEATIKVRHNSIEELELPPQNTPIAIRRELQRSGKSRCFIDDQQVSLQQLRQVLGRSIEMVDQGSAASLCSEEEQRYLLDGFASLQSDIARFSAQFEAQKGAEVKLQELIDLQKRGALEQTRIEEDLAEINEVNWLPGEEEALSEEHSLLTHAQELLEKIGAVTHYLSDSKLRRLSYQLEQMVPVAPKIEPAVQSLKNGLLELEEGASLLASFGSSIESNPNRVAAIDERIGAIERLKKRFAPNYDAIESLKREWTAKLNRISNLDEEIEIARTDAAQLQAMNLKDANKITQKRERAAIAFAKSVNGELKTLNLPHAVFAILLEPKPMSQNGSNAIRFLFAANPGQTLAPLDSAPSGGELSRLLFAIKTALADKEESGCLIFDEIDGNVGGQTAAILGEKLEALSQNRQLICITHFVQVAKKGAHHFLVAKHSTPTEAITKVSLLNSSQKEVEYERMTGCIKISSPLFSK